MKVRFTPTARKQFLSIVKTIAMDRQSAASRFASKARRILSRLGEFPESGRRLPEFPDLPHREVVVAPYRFSYRVHGRVVWIVSVWHGAQIPDTPDDVA